MTTGTIVIKPLTAQLTRDTDTFSRMDPYVKVILGTRSVTTTVAKKAGKNPNWTDELTIRRSNNEDIIKIEVWDKDKHTKDDLVGATSVSFSTVEAKKYKLNEWVEVTYKGKSAGKVLLDIQFYPDASNTKKEEVINHNNPAPSGGYPVQGFIAPFVNNMMPQTGIPMQIDMQHQYQQQYYIQPQQQAFPSFGQQFMQPPQMYQPNQFSSPQQQQQQAYGQQAYIPMQPQFQPPSQPQLQPQNQYQYQPQSQPQVVPNHGQQMKR